MLAGIETEAIEVAGREIPSAPLQELVVDRLIHLVDIGTHEVVVVAVVAVIDLLAPVLAGEEIDAASLCGLVPVHRVEVVPVPLEVGVLAVASRECEAGPGLDLAGRCDGVLAVPRVHLLGCDLFSRICAEPVVQHDVAERLDTCIMEGIDGSLVFFLRAVLRADRSLLVELAQIVGVVDAVADIHPAGRALVGRRQPDGCDAIVGKELRILGDAAPGRAIRIEIPRESLQHRSVHGAPPAAAALRY